MLLLLPRLLLFLEIKKNTFFFWFDQKWFVTNCVPFIVLVFVFSLSLCRLAIEPSGKLAFYLRFVHSITNRNWILIKSHLIHDCVKGARGCSVHRFVWCIRICRESRPASITVESNSIHCTYTRYFHSSLQSAFIHLLHAITNIFRYLVLLII